MKSTALQSTGDRSTTLGTKMLDVPLNCVLLSFYDLGHQPVGVAEVARRLTDSGYSVRCNDLAVEQPDEAAIAAADVVGIHVPMHTATRLALASLPRIRGLNPDARIVAFGLYAALYKDVLLAAGVDTTSAMDVESAIVHQDQDSNGKGTQAAATAVPGRRLVAPGRRTDVVPLRDGLPDLARYVRLRTGDGDRVVGRTDTTRGCKHLCRHCPIPPVYDGKFFAVEQQVVLDDIDRLVQAGAEHITFGDPDFFNGPMHGLRIARKLNQKYPKLTWDCTIKIEHLAEYRHHLAELDLLGCVLITTAVESFDEDVLEVLDKGHTMADFEAVLRATREIGIGLNPTFVPFSPMTTPESYREFLGHIRRLDLYHEVAPIQYTIRLLVTAGSALLETGPVKECVRPFNSEALVHEWVHPDRRVDLLQKRVLHLVQDLSEESNSAVFLEIWRETLLALEDDYVALVSGDDQVDTRKPIPYLTEPWYC